MMIGWIGVGNLGGAIIERLIASGHRPCIFDSRSEAVAQFANRAEIAADLPSLVRKCDVVFSTLPNDVAFKVVADQALKELREKLATAPERFTEDHLRRAFESTHHKALLDIISMVKRATDEQGRPEVIGHLLNRHRFIDGRGHLR